MKLVQHVLALAGGVGGGKLARGLAAILPPEALTLVVNTGDDFTHLNLRISPDIDSVLYALADLNDPIQGWGLKEDTDHVMDALARLRGDTWFRLRDRDLATHLLRTQKLIEGLSLSQVTELLADRLGVRHKVVPMTDASVRTIINTDLGALDFQHYFVRLRAEPKFHQAHFDGAAEATPSGSFSAAIESATAIVICPSNPYLSIDPILSLPGIRALLEAVSLPIVAVSPIVDGKAVKGPLAKIMREQGLPSTSLSIAQHYGGLVHGWMIDEADRSEADAIMRLGCAVRVLPILMTTLSDKTNVARAALDFAAELAARPGISQ